jgi:thioredoxin 1
LYTPSPHVFIWRRTLQLGIKVAPTFLLYKGGKLVEKMTGAKSEQLRELIEKHI